jgi:hypothetical protein
MISFYEQMTISQFIDTFDAGDYGTNHEIFYRDGSTTTYDQSNVDDDDYKTLFPSTWAANSNLTLFD